MLGPDQRVGSFPKGRFYFQDFPHRFPASVKVLRSRKATSRALAAQ